MRCTFVTLVLMAAASSHAQPDLRTHYDVKTYRLDLNVEPEQKMLDGWVGIEATVVHHAGLKTLHVDAAANLEIDRVIALAKAIDGVTPMEGAQLDFERTGAKLLIDLGRTVKKGDAVRVGVRYRSKPPAATKEGERSGGQRRRRGRRRGSRTPGVLWRTSADGSPWVGTSCQGPGAHVWWPCKSNWFHANDKFDTLFVNATVKRGLYAVSNGRLENRTVDGDRETFHWRHPYGCETYAVTLNVAPYVVVEKSLQLPGLEKEVPFIYYVLPENAEKAAVQFKQVPALLTAFSKAFGPWPFPDAKFALVESSFWGMEHSTAVAYGSSYPAWCKENDARDRYAGRNRFFDYILVHEVAHEWWGNAVSASDWGHFWVHEGFGTYAEGVYLEFTEGRERADEYFGRGARRAAGPRSRLYRGKGVTSGAAYSGVIYSKGSAVLHTLRQYVNDDTKWWKSLRDFNMKHRYGHASTEDFQKALEANTGKKWGRFFKEWFYGTGAPRTTGTVSTTKNGIAIKVEIEGQFHVPLDLGWTENGNDVEHRAWLEPGKNTINVKCAHSPTALTINGLGRILGRHDVTVQ